MGESNLAINARHRAEARGYVPSAAALDAIAERAITGGYRVGRANRCPLHNMARSVNGVCALCD